MSCLQPTPNRYLHSNRLAGAFVFQQLVTLKVALNLVECLASSRLPIAICTQIALPWCKTAMSAAIFLRVWVLQDGCTLGHFRAETFGFHPSLELAFASAGAPLGSSRKAAWSGVSF